MRAKFLGWVAVLVLSSYPLSAQQEIERVKKEVKEELGDKYTIEVVQGIFVVASDDAGPTYQRAKGTIKHVYNAMYKDFMQTKPDKPLKVYLFKDKQSYERYCKKAYGTRPSTPFGFYRSAERKMIMNIGTGTGTLAHELVHPLLEADFPGVPSWFNEGFASLYEQSRYTSTGSMKGMVNWRLPGLKSGLREVSLKRLMQTTSSEFYRDRSGLNYAAARYLCLYLQEKGVLAKFYKAFKEVYPKKDKTGIKTLQKVLGKRLNQIEPEWKKWVKGLRW
jgi:hypothetical protein